MAGRYIADGDAANVRNQNPGQNVVVILDVTNSTGDVTAGMLPTAAHQPPLGVVQNTLKLDSSNSNTPFAGQYLTLRHEGDADIRVASAVTAGDLVTIADTAGRVATAVQTAAAAQPVIWIVGRAKTSATNVDDTVTVLLAPGGWLY